MSKRALGILAAIEGLVILGLAGALVGVGRMARGMGHVGFGRMHHGALVGMHSVGVFPVAVHWLLGLVPIVLVAIVVALILKPRAPEPPSR